MLTVDYEYFTYPGRPTEAGRQAVLPAGDGDQYAAPSAATRQDLLADRQAIAAGHSHLRRAAEKEVKWNSTSKNHFTERA